MAPSYRDLRVWQLAMELVISVYTQTRGFPKEETYGLTSQMRRSAVSIPSNIAEGKGRSTDADRAVFSCHARGSLLELETQILIAQHLEYVEASAAEKLMGEFRPARPYAERTDPVTEESSEVRRSRCLSAGA